MSLTVDSETRLSEDRDVVVQASTGGGGSGSPSAGGPTVITVGAGATEDLPDPTTTDTCAVVPTGDGAIQDPNGNDIYWSPRTASSFSVYARIPLFLSSDGSSWHVENPSVYELESFIPNQPLADNYVLRHVARHPIKALQLRIDAETAPASQHDWIADVLHPDDTTTSVATVSQTTGTKRQTETLGQVLAENDVLRIKTDVATGNFDDTIADVALNVNAIRV